MKKFLSKTGIKKRAVAFASGGILVIFLFFTSPMISVTLGNIFFGQIPSFYNVTLAQFFFKRAASPFFGNTPPFANYQLSRTYFIQGDFDNAIYYANKELELYPKNIRTYYILGLTYGYMNREEEAIASFATFIKHNPKSWAARNDKAWLEFRVGDIDAALATVGPVSHDTSNAWVQNTYGTLLLNKKRYLEARSAFQSAQKVVNSMTEESWGMAYPGNDPRIYKTGLAATRKSIEVNLKLVEQKILSKR